VIITLLFTRLIIYIYHSTILQGVQKGILVKILVKRLAELKTTHLKALQAILNR